MSDPYTFECTFDGAVLRSGDEPKSSRDARITASPEGLHVAATDGTTLELKWRRVRLIRDPQTAAIVIQSREPAVTISSSDPDFVRSIETAGGNDLNDQLSRLQGEKVASGWKHNLSCTLVLAFVMVMIWALPRMFRGAVDASVSALPYSVDEAIGEQVFEVLELGKEIDDPVVRAAIQQILDRLTPTTSEDQPGAKFVFKVVESDDVNAFALPGGYIVVFSGLIREAQSPEQVAGVIAHEMAHVTRRHGMHRIAHKIGLWTAVTLFFGSTTDALTNIAVTLFGEASANDYSQEQETEADLIGTRMLIQAEIDPAGLASFFSMLEERHGDIPDSLKWFSTHPQHKERVAAIEEFAAEHGRGVEYRPLDVAWEEVRASIGD